MSGSLLDDLEPEMPEGDRLRRSDWFVRACTQAEAAGFITEMHYAGGAANTSSYRHAICRAGGIKVHGVAMWMVAAKPAAVSVDPDNWRGVLALSRLCVEPGMPTNSASFLLGASMRLIDRSRWPTLLTYADTREGHTGAIYKATNWECLGEVDGSDAWLHSASGLRRGRRAGPRNFSAAEMAQNGYERLPAMPKVKFIHRSAA